MHKVIIPRDKSMYEVILDKVSIIEILISVAPNPTYGTGAQIESNEDGIAFFRETRVDSGTI